MTLFHSTSRSLASMLLALVCLQTPTAFGHGSGHQPITEGQALELASATIEQLTSRDVGLGFGQLDSAWKAVPAGSSRIHTKTNRYYIVSVDNVEEGRTLFILMSSSGEVYDANFSGDFSQLQ